MLQMEEQVGIVMSGWGGEEGEREREEEEENCIAVIAIAITNRALPPQERGKRAMKAPQKNSKGKKKGGKTPFLYTAPHSTTGGDTQWTRPYQTPAMEFAFAPSVIS